MIIKALRVSEVGCFTSPQALEGLSGHLDVLAGPNELGKSTLLRALAVLFGKEHTSMAQTLRKEIQPYTGGAPTIEAEFELAGQMWRLRKRYFSAKSAELRNLSTGEIDRGEDAETRLDALKAGSGLATVGLNMLWVGQTETLRSIEPDEGTTQTLRGLLASEIEAMVSGSDAIAVRKAVDRALEDYFTATGRLKKTGRLQAAIDERDQLVEELDAARRREKQSAAHSERLEVIRRERAELDDPAAEAARQEALAKAEAAVAAVTERERALQNAQSDFKLKAIELERIITALQAAERDAKERDSLQEKADDIAEHIDSTRTKSEHLQQRITAAKRQRDALERQLATARYLSASGRLAKARERARTLAELDAAIEANAVTQELMERIDAETRSISTLEARLAAALPAVSVAYDKGTRTRIRAHGRAIDDGETLHPDGPLVLEVPGVGRITITPGASEAVEEDRRDLDAHCTILAELLQSGGVNDPQAARQSCDRRRTATMQRSEVTAQINALAPDGIAALEASLRTLSEVLPDPPDMLQDGSRTPSEPDLAELDAQLRDLNRELEQLANEKRDIDAALARLEAAEKARVQRLAALSEHVRTPNDLAALQKAHADAVKAADDARWLLETCRRALPDAEQRRDLDKQVERAKAGLADAARRLHELEREAVRLETQLEADGRDGIGETANALAERHQAAEARVATLTREADALRLLKQTLDAVHQETASRLHAPIGKRLRPYLEILFPDAVAAFDSHLKPDAIERGGRREPIERLSRGTQEQIAVLARLAYARVLADTGTPVPLILDDALVYSDDERMERMFQALRLAAEHHQVIVLTCRAKAFESLGGTALQLVPWQNAA